MGSKPTNPKKSAGKKHTNRGKKNKKKTEPMPSLIFNEIKLSNQNLKTEPDTPDTLEIEEHKLTGEELSSAPMNTFSFFEYSEKEKTARRWMYIGVVSFLAMIITMWGWSFYLNFSLFNWNKGSDYSLVNNSLKNWDVLFKKQEQEQQLEQTKQSLRGVLQKLANAQMTTSTDTTTSSGTENISTTTTSNSN